MIKVCILTSREIGEKCVMWAKHNLPENILLVDDPSDSDVIISVMYAKLLKSNILENKRCLNFHPGTLPSYRGSGACSWAIINEESKIGISLHEIDDGIDTGPVIEITEIPIREYDTAETLHHRLNEVIFRMFKGWFVDLVLGNYTAVKQCGLTTKPYFRKDLQKAKDLTRFVKAFSFKGKESAFYYNDKNEKIYINFKESSNERD
jgi:methionyl-tRNA formyltransferase